MTPYIRQIRNPLKREYAIAYLTWLMNGQKGPEPEPDLNLSYMAAQAVRLELQRAKRPSLKEHSPIQERNGK
jgi:hypothetical protein